MMEIIADIHKYIFVIYYSLTTSSSALTGGGCSFRPPPPSSSATISSRGDIRSTSSLCGLCGGTFASWRTTPTTTQAMMEVMQRQTTCGCTLHSPSLPAFHSGVRVLLQKRGELLFAVV